MLRQCTTQDVIAQINSIAEMLTYGCSILMDTSIKGLFALQAVPGRLLFSFGPIDRWHLALTPDGGLMVLFCRRLENFDGHSYQFVADMVAGNTSGLIIPNWWTVLYDDHGNRLTDDPLAEVDFAAIFFSLIGHSILLRQSEEQTLQRIQDLFRQWLTQSEIVSSPSGT